MLTHWSYVFLARTHRYVHKETSNYNPMHVFPPPETWFRCQSVVLKNGEVINKLEVTGFIGKGSGNIFVMSRTLSPQSSWINTSHWLKCVIDRWKWPRGRFDRERCHDTSVGISIIKINGCYDDHFIFVIWASVRLKITGNSTDCLYRLTACTGEQQRKHQSSAIWTLCEGNPLETGVFFSQRASNANFVSMTWRAHEILVVEGEFSMPLEGGGTSMRPWWAHTYGRPLCRIHGAAPGISGTSYRMREL